MGTPCNRGYRRVVKRRVLLAPANVRKQYVAIGLNSAFRAPLSSCSLRVPVCSGRSFRIDSPPGNALVTPELATELERVLKIFGKSASNGSGNRVGIFFKPGIFGHHKVGRAADIYAVGGLGLDQWKRLWDAAQDRYSRVSDANVRRAIMNRERRMNLGWRLYKNLRLCGRWSQPYGYPIQLFGPWTRSEGPWKYISDFLLNAHRDHIHVAK